MDLINGRNRELNALVFTDRPSGYEILTVDWNGDRQGLVYHPLKFDPPIAWHSQCHHCVSGRMKGIPISIKRGIQLLCTHKIYHGFSFFRVPSNLEAYWLMWKLGDFHCAMVISKTQEISLGASSDPKATKAKSGLLISYQGNPRSFQSPILKRSMDLIRSVRVPNSREVAAVINPFLLREWKIGKKPRVRRACERIPWSDILTSKMEEKSDAQSANSR